MEKTNYGRPLVSQGSKVKDVIPSNTIELEYYEKDISGGFKAPVLFITKGGLLKFVASANEDEEWVTTILPDASFFPIHIKKVHTDTTCEGILQIL